MPKSQREINRALFHDVTILHNTINKDYSEHGFEMFITDVQTTLSSLCNVAFAGDVDAVIEFMRDRFAMYKEDDDLFQ